MVGSLALALTNGVTITFTATQHSYDHASYLCNRYVKGMHNVNADVYDSRGGHYTVPCSTFSK